MGGIVSDHTSPSPSSADSSCSYFAVIPGSRGGRPVEILATRAEPARPEAEGVTITMPLREGAVGAE